MALGKRALKKRRKIYNARYRSKPRVKKHEAAYTKQWRATHPEQAKAHGLRHYYKHQKEMQAYSKDWKKNHPEACLIHKRTEHLKTRYGIPPEQYQELYNKQKGCCAICGGSGLKLHVDHCHTTQLVRMLLCNSCNLLLGFSKEQIDVLQKAIKYIKFWRKRHGTLIQKGTGCRYRGYLLAATRKPTAKRNKRNN
jgi:hypothetical protein